MVELKKCYMRGAKDHRAHSSCIIGIRENWKTLNLIRHEKDRGQQVGTYLGGGKGSGQEYLKETLRGKRQYKQRCNVC